MEPGLSKPTHPAWLPTIANLVNYECYYGENEQFACCDCVTKIDFIIVGIIPTIISPSEDWMEVWIRERSLCVGRIVIHSSYRNELTTK